jgi:hypothetical protein
MIRTQGFIQYLAGGLFLAFSLYQVSRDELWEFSLYAIVGAAFITMGLIKDKRFPRYHKLLSILSWILIISAGFMLLFLVRTDV